MALRWRVWPNSLNSKETRKLASLWLPLVVVMALIYYGSSRPDGARPITRPIRAAITWVLAGGQHA